MIRENNNLHGAHIGSSELLGADTSEAHLLPHAGNIGLLGGLECGLILLQLNQYLSEFLIVSDL